MNQDKTLNPGDPGYEEAFHAKPHTGKGGEILRLKSPLDAQREADEENNRRVAEAKKAEVKAANKNSTTVANAADKKAN